MFDIRCPHPTRGIRPGSGGEERVVPIEPEVRIEMYRRMLCIRVFEEQAIERQTGGDIPGVVHTSIGQEATVVGACMALRPDDYMTGTHRSHGHPIGKGARLDALMAELMGKRTGVCKGKGGSMHLADFSVGSLGESGIVGGGMPIATGAGLSAKLRRTDQVCLCFFGDGASNTGAFHESLNLASVWKLPVIYLCENNQYAFTTAAAHSVSVPDIADRAAGYSMPGTVVDGQDVLLVHEVALEAVDRARRGDGPSLVEAKTYRHREHAEMGGFDVGPYRSEEEVATWTQRDPVLAFRARLLDDRTLDESGVGRLEAAVRDEVKRAVDFALESAYPARDELLDDVYVEPIPIHH
jgi:pyruvate dehydrogenase E1 component alpha subunit